MLLQGCFYRDAVPLATPAGFDGEPVQLTGDGAVAHALPFERPHGIFSAALW